MNPKEKTSLKNMEYNRYILLRYSLALFFFANLNWFITLLMDGSIFLFVPLLLLVYAIFPITEQVKLYGTENKNYQLKQMKKYFNVQLTLNIVLWFLSLYEPFYNIAFPFMANDVQGFSGISIVLMIGSVISIACLRKIGKIHNHQDRTYKQVLKFKKSIGVYE